MLWFRRSALLCLALGAACSEPRPTGFLSEFCGDEDFAELHPTVCFGGCKDPELRGTPACVPCLADPLDPLCNGAEGTSTGMDTESTGTTDGPETDTEPGTGTGTDTEPETDTEEPTTMSTGTDTGGEDVLIDQVAAGYSQSCALGGDRFKCWGLEGPATGQPWGGGAKTADAATEHPELDLGGTPDDFGSGSLHACALMGTDVLCWGRGASSGLLGYGNDEDIGDNETPASAGAVPLGRMVDQLAVGAFHNCALLSDQTVRCWGLGIFGELGYGNTDNIGDNELPSSVGPVDVGGTPVAVTAGFQASCALLDDGTVRCWGFNLDGGLGLGHTNDIGDNELPSSEPTVNVGGTVEQVQMCGLFACALLDTGALRCWGSNLNGQLGYGHLNNIGDDEDPATAGDVPVGDDVAQFSCGSTLTCALTDAGDVKCWGSGVAGQLGQGNTDSVGDNETPDSIGAIDLGGPAASVHAGANHACALMQDGAVRCWGHWTKLGYGDGEHIGDDEVPSAIDPVTIFDPS